MIESCGVPHPEVDLILFEGQPVNFSAILHNNSAVDVYPVEFTQAIIGKDRLQSRGLTQFVADGHLGKLTRNLRLLGFDVAYQNRADDDQLLQQMQREARTLLTRDRRLLMHSIVKDGYYPRSQDPNEQTVEVLRRFQLFSSIQPFRRCLHCNGQLVDVAKADVMDALRPLTRLYYERFRRCPDCGRIYWPGSHFDKLNARIEEFRAKLAI